MLIGRSYLVVLVLACCILPVNYAYAKKDVTLDRILLQHSMHVVSTEDAKSIGKYLFNLQMNDMSTMTLTDLLIKGKHFKDEEGIFFIIDRSKARRISPEEEAFLPCPTAAIDPNQIILYAKKSTRQERMGNSAQCTKREMAELGA